MAQGAKEAIAVTMLDIPAAAKRLSVSERFVKRLVLERRVAYHKVGRFVRFDPVDLDRFLADCRIEKAQYER